MTQADFANLAIALQEQILQESDPPVSNTWEADTPYLELNDFGPDERCRWISPNRLEYQFGTQRDGIRAGWVVGDDNEIQSITLIVEGNYGSDAGSGRLRVNGTFSSELQAAGLGFAGTMFTSGTDGDGPGQPFSYTKGPVTPPAPITLNEMVSGGAWVDFSMLRVDTSNDILPDDEVNITSVRLVILSSSAAPSPLSWTNGFGLELYADCTGVESPYELETVYPFDDGTGWSASPNGSHLSITDGTNPEGTEAQGQALGEKAIDTENDASSWTSTTGTLSDVADTDIGKNVVQCVGPLIGGPLNDARRTFTLAVAANDHYFVDIQPEILYSRPDRLTFRLVLEDSGGNERWWEWLAIELGNFAWNTIVFEQTNFTGGDAGFNPALANAFRVELEHTGTGAVPTADTLSFRVHDLDISNDSGTYIIQKNGLALDLTPSATEVAGIYPMYILKQISGDLPITLIASSETLAGLTAPSADFATLDYKQSVAGSWEVVVNHSYAESGAYDITSVKTLRIETTFAALPVTGLYPFSAPTLSSDIFGYAVDAFSRVLIPTTPYLADVGSFLSHPLDIARAMVEFAGQSFDVDSWNEAIARTDLTLKLAGDLRASGYSWPELFADVLRHGALNAKQDGLGVWHFWTPQFTDNSWQDPAGPDRTLTQWDRDGLVVNHRDTDQEVFTRYELRYAPDITLGVGEEVYTGVLRATPEESDFPSAPPSVLSALESQIGIKPAPLLEMRLIQDRATALTIGDYYLYETLRVPRVVAVSGSPWWESLDAELSEDVEVVIPWSGETFRGRLLAVGRNTQSGQQELRLLEIVK